MQISKYIQAFLITKDNNQVLIDINDNYFWNLFFPKTRLD